MNALTRRDLQRRGSPHRHAPVPIIDVPPPGILAKNNEETDCPAGGLLMITGTHQAADGAGTDYFEGYRPDGPNLANVAVAAQEIPAGYIGRCRIDGLCMIATAESGLSPGDRLGSQNASFQAADGVTHEVFFTEAYAGGTRIYARRAAASSGVRRAVAQANAAASTALSVKFADAGGSEVGSAFNAYNIEGENWDDVLPLIADGDKLLVVQIDGTWYGVGFIYIGACA